MRTCSQPSSRNSGHSMSRNSGAAKRTANDVRGANFLAAKPTAKWPTNNLDALQEPVQLVGRVKIGFQLARAQALAQLVEAPCEQIERGGKDLPVGEHNVAPHGIGTACQPQRIAQAGTGESDGQAVLI